MVKTPALKIAVGRHREFVQIFKPFAKIREIRGGMLFHRFEQVADWAILSLSLATGAERLLSLENFRCRIRVKAYNSTLNKLYRGVHRFLLEQGPSRVLFLSVLVMLVLGGFDYWTGFEISFSFFYLIPIALATIYGNFRNGMFITVLSILIWTLSNRLAGETYSSNGIWVWNAGIRMVTFTGIAFLLHQLNLSVEHENLLSRTDFLTGIHNTREFHRAAAIELERARTFRHSLSVAYIDLDNFKQVNDQFGHRAGDELLRAIAQTVSTVIRRGDLFARLGGDEFILLLPETDDRNVKQVIGKVRRALGGQSLVRKLNTTTSIGVITFAVPPGSVDEVIQAADKLMYKVKTDGKDGVLFHVEG